MTDIDTTTNPPLEISSGDAPSDGELPNAADTLLTNPGSAGTATATIGSREADEALADLAQGAGGRGVIFPGPGGLQPGVEPDDKL